MKSAFLAILTVVIVVCALDIYSHTGYVQNTNAHHREFIDMSEFPLLLNSKYPITIRNIYDQLPLFFNDTLPDASYVGNLLSPMRITSHVEHVPLNGKIKTTFNNRTYLIQKGGESVVCLFHPSHNGLLYTKEKQNGHKESPIDTTAEDLDSMYPLFKHSSYMEIKMKPKMLLSVPPNWSYCTKASDKNSNVILVTSNTVGSTINFLLR